MAGTPPCTFEELGCGPVPPCASYVRVDSKNYRQLGIVNPSALLNYLAQCQGHEAGEVEFVLHLGSYVVEHRSPNNNKACDARLAE